MKLYILLNKCYNKIKSYLYIIDLKLKGAHIPCKVTIQGRVQVRDASNLNIDEGVVIGRNVIVNFGGGHVKIGKNSVIGQNVRLDALDGDIVLGNKVIINSNTIITSWSGVIIGNDTGVASFCHITDRNHGLRKDLLHTSQKGTTKPIFIGSDVWIASSCIILQGVKIDNGAVIGANSLVNKNVAAYDIAAGSPVRIIGKKK